MFVVKDVLVIYLFGGRVFSFRILFSDYIPLVNTRSCLFSGFMC